MKNYVDKYVVQLLLLFLITGINFFSGCSSSSTKTENLLVTGVTAEQYTITINWVNPTIKGFEHISITCSDGTLSETVDAAKETGTYSWTSFSSVPLLEDTKYSFSLQASDDSGSLLLEPLLFSVSTTAGETTDYLTIYTADDLNAVRGAVEGYESWGLDKNYLVMTDIDLSKYGKGEGWNPLGEDSDDSDSFSGIFLGNNHVITNLSINRDSIYQGLFGYIHNGTVQDLVVENASISGKGVVGGLVGVNNGTVINCTSSGTITGTLGQCGGLIGRNMRDVYDSSSTATVLSEDDHAGGLIGRNWFSLVETITISNCHAAGTVAGKGFTGGLIGESRGTTGNIILINCYATGSVSGTDYSGGLAGSISFTSGTITITNCYAVGMVNGNEYNGGLAGSVHATDSTITITNCYSTGNVTGTLTCNGGLMGECETTSGIIDISNCHATGNVAGPGYLGGLIGEADTTAGTTKIEDCYATGTITPQGGTAGGLIGYNGIPLINCYATGSISEPLSSGEESGPLVLGGLVGRNYASINNSYATGDVAGVSKVGGLTGFNSGDITNCYCTGDVNSSYLYSGGFVGENSGEITKCYSSGSFIGNSRSGGFVGRTYEIAVYTSCYWNADLLQGTVTADCGYEYTDSVQYFDIDDEEIFASTTSSMQNSATYTGWDFTAVWEIDDDETEPLVNNGYPFLLED